MEISGAQSLNLSISNLLNNGLAFVGGIVDVTDYRDVYGLVNPWTDFNNFAFTTNPTIPAPDQGLGAAVRFSTAENFYIVAGMADANRSHQRLVLREFASVSVVLIHLGAPSIHTEASTSVAVAGVDVQADVAVVTH